jgi:hypothetical protein
MTQSAEREVCLGPEYAMVYPSLVPGEWVPASQWAAAIVTRAQEARVQGRYQRTFDPRHCEFRGGPPPRSPGAQHRRTRAEDA